jgi:hypothetical protein
VNGADVLNAGRLVGADAQQVVAPDSRILLLLNYLSNGGRAFDVALKLIELAWAERSREDLRSGPVLD